MFLNSFWARVYSAPSGAMAPNGTRPARSSVAIWRQAAISSTRPTAISLAKPNAGRVAIAWIAAKGVLPITGPRTRAQLDDNLKAADVKLNGDQLGRLDQASAVALGFPHELLAVPSYRQRIAGGKLELLDLPAHPVA